MEAHVLGSLVPSIEHLILIGDPLQLRPTLNNFCEFRSIVAGAESNSYIALQPYPWTAVEAESYTNLICR